MPQTNANHGAGLYQITARLGDEIHIRRGGTRASLLGFLPICEEPFEADVGHGMFPEFFEDGVGHGAAISTARQVRT